MCVSDRYLEVLQQSYSYYPRREWAATGIVVCQSVCLLPEARVGCHGYSSLSVCLLPEARVGGHGYSSLLVCLFVCLSVTHESAHLAATAWIAFTQQVISFKQ